MSPFQIHLDADKEAVFPQTWKYCIITRSFGKTPGCWMNSEMSAR